MLSSDEPIDSSACISTKPRIMRRLVFALFFGLVGWAIDPPKVQAEVPVVPRGQIFECTPTHVWDGDGPIWCAEGPRLRLAGIAAREIDETCSRGHPCPQATGQEALAALVSLLGVPTGTGRHGHTLVHGPTITCRSDGSAGGNRTAAWCISPRTGDINCLMVVGGWALRWDRYWNDHIC